MSYFLNYENGAVSVNTYRNPRAEVTDVDDIRSAIKNNTNEILTSSLSQDELAEFGVDDEE